MIVVIMIGGGSSATRKVIITILLERHYQYQRYQQKQPKPLLLVIVVVVLVRPVVTVVVIIIIIVNNAIVVFVIGAVKVRLTLTSLASSQSCISTSQLLYFSCSALRFFIRMICEKLNPENTVRNLVIVFEGRHFCWLFILLKSIAKYLNIGQGYINQNP